ncbi:unnamed protein product [Brassica oleracea]
MLCNTSATNFPREMEFRGVECSRFRDKYFIFAFYDEDVEPPDHVFLGICYLQMHWHDGLTSKDSTVHIKNTSGVNRCEVLKIWCGVSYTKSCASISGIRSSVFLASW